MRTILILLTLNLSLLAQNWTIEVVDSTRANFVRTELSLR